MIRQGFFLLLLTLPACTAWAEVYHCKTGRGTINYTNVPCIDEAPPKLVKHALVGGKKVEWVDPSQLPQPSKVATIEPIAVDHSNNAPMPTAKATVQDSYTTAIIEPYTETTPPSSTQTATVLVGSQYKAGMRWLLRSSGTYVTYEHYEITHVKNQIVSWTRTLLNANKQPFAGGLTETFTMDLRQQPVASDEPTQLRLAGYVFDAYKHQTEQAVSWHVSNLPLITPLIRYRSGDTTELVEFNP